MTKELLSSQNHVEEFNEEFCSYVFQKLDKYLQKLSPENAHLTSDTPKNWERIELEYNICATNFYEYLQIFDFCTKHGIDRVIDVGGGNGLAQFIIDRYKMPLKYVILDKTPANLAFAPVIFDFYPLKLHPTPRDALVSHLCLGMLLTPQSEPQIFDQAIADFDHVILQISEQDARPLLAKFPHSIISAAKITNIYYFDTSSHNLLSQNASSPELQK